MTRCCHRASSDKAFLLDQAVKTGNQDIEDPAPQLVSVFICSPAHCRWQIWLLGWGWSCWGGGCSCQFLKGLGKANTIKARGGDKTLLVPPLLV